LGLAIGAGLGAVCIAPDSKAPAKAAPKTAAELFPQTIAKGKGFEVKRSRLDEELTSFKAAAAARNQQIPPEQEALLKQQILDRLISIELLMQKATDADRAKGKENTKKRLDQIQERAGSEEAFSRQLKAVGTNIEEVQRKMGEEMTAESVLERELKVNVSEEDVKKFYDENPTQFEQPEQVRAAHILLGTRDASGNELSAEKKAEKKKEIEALLKRARGGEDFAKLAQQYSEDPGSKETGGEYTFPRGQMVPEFETTAFGLKTNEVSEVVTTQFGYHIIKLYEKLPARTVPLKEVESRIRDYLKNQQVQKELPAYMAKLKKEANVEILDDKLKPHDEQEDHTGHNHPPIQPAPGKK
jgi:peptidyl-prolyl cis-trans isomerase C